jgi:multidrug efflux pump subunit AcrB
MKSLIKAALRRPVTILVIVGAVFFGSFLAIKSIPIDIFPKLNLPVIYVIEPYAGMTPQQMEGFFSTRLQDQFLYVSGIKNISSKNIQGISILKLSFFEKTDMAEATAEVAVQLNRAMQFFPPGALPPQVIRFDASSLPVGTLVFSSPDRDLEEIHDLAATRIRPLFSTIPGLSAPPPIGSNQRTVLINIDPEKLRSYNMTPDDVVAVMTHNNITAPSGNISTGNTTYMATTNALEGTVETFGDIPVKSDNASTVFLHDLATIQDGSDVTTGYALINGKRSIYMPIIKTPDASTWEVVQKLKAKIPEMQSLLPDDVHISYEFDQSVFVINSVKSIISEGITGAVLTALMILLFLRDWRSCIVVIITIPLAIFSAVFLLNLFGQTINIMTLGGLALAIGILVDESTVTIENIHQHLEMGKSKRKAILEACEEIALPKLLILLSILAVFVPAGLMTGVPRAMFLPLSLAVGFAMISSFLLSQTLVPIISNWLLKEDMYQGHHAVNKGHGDLALNRKENTEFEDTQIRDEQLKGEEHHPPQKNFFERLKIRFHRRLEQMMQKKKRNVSLYLVLVFALAAGGFMLIGKDLLPKTNNGQYQLKLRMPDGTRLERTEAMMHDVLQMLDSITNNHVSISSAYVGMMPPNYATSNLYVFNAGTHEASVQIQLDEHFKMNKDRFQDLVRNTLQSKLPQVSVSFEPIELTEKIMSQGAATPIEVEVGGKNMQDIEDYANRLVGSLKQVSFMRDVLIEQPLKYPSVKIVLDRSKIAQMGLRLQDVSRSVSDFTSSSRYTEKNLWLDTKNSYTYQVQAQIPQYRLNDISQLKEIPVQTGQTGLVLQDVATFQVDTVPGEYDRSGPRRFITVSANLYKKDLGRGTAATDKAIKDLGPLPKGLTVQVKGMSNLLTETLDSLQSGLLLAIIVIFLLLAANYQSFRASLAVLSSVPAVLLGALGLLLITGSTLNLQSYMGIIMAVGVSVANAILIVTNAEKIRFENNNNIRDAAATSASIRLRPILMTSLAMIAGMIPMASGIGEAGDQTAPLGRAIIGGLMASTVAALFIVPQCYAWLQQKATLKSPSLLPEWRLPRVVTNNDNGSDAIPVTK